MLQSTLMPAHLAFYFGEYEREEVEAEGGVFWDQDPASVPAAIVVVVGIVFRII
jgi:hypothetical protein